MDMTRQNRNSETPPDRQPAESKYDLEYDLDYDLDQTLTQPVTPISGRQVVLVPGQSQDREIERQGERENTSSSSHPMPAVKPRLRRPSWFWPGFAAGFLLLSILSCGGLVMATGLNRLDLADIQGNGVVWTPPAVTPTATPDAADVADQATSVTGGAFQLRDTVRNVTSSRVNIRQTPGHLGKSDSDIVAQLQPDDTMQIVAGPAPADNLTWWLIQYQADDGRLVEGWVAEATGSGVQILGR
jgi:hypothetical protein